MPPGACRPCSPLPGATTQRPLSVSHRPPAPSAVAPKGSVDPTRVRRLGSPASKDGARLQAQPRAPSPALEVLQPSGAGVPQGCSSCQDSSGGGFPGKQLDPRRRGWAGDGRARVAPPRGGAAGSCPRYRRRRRWARRERVASPSASPARPPPALGLAPLPQGCPQSRSCPAIPSWLLICPWARAQASPISAGG